MAEPHQIERYLEDLSNALRGLSREPLELLIAALSEARTEGRRVFLVGNGGSAATASHFAQDLLKAAGCKALALTDSVPTLLAYANDCGFETVFAEQLGALASPEDVLIAISGSGQSENVLQALKLARSRGLFTVGLTGRDGGAMKELCDLPIVVPAEKMEQIEDLHLVVAHLVVTALREGVR